MLHGFIRSIRKIAKSDHYLRHVRSSVRMVQLGFHWTDFHEIWYLKIFRKSAEKIQVSSKSDKNNGYFTWRLTYIFYHILLTMKNVLDKIRRENQNTRIMLNNFPKIVPLWDNGKIVERARPQMTIRCVCIACWIPKTTNTHSYNM